MWISFSRRRTILGAMTVGALTLTGGVSAVAADDISTQSDEILSPRR